MARFDRTMFATATDLDNATYELLMKVHKGATASFTAKSTAQVLALFPGWTMVQAALIAQSNEARPLVDATAVLIDEPATYYGDKLLRPAGPRARSMHAYSSTSDRSNIRLVARFYDEQEITLIHAEVAKFVVQALPDAKTAKADGLFVMNLSAPAADSEKDRCLSFSFDLFRKVRGHVITAPNGQSFQVVGPVQVLGFGGTTTFHHFFQWALKNTDLEAVVNAKLGLAKHVPASERPRVPVGGQTIGTCAICLNDQVVQKGAMVLHGYERPGHGYITGNCFGYKHQPYETSAEACVAYLPVLNIHLRAKEQRLRALTSGQVTEFSQKKYDRRTRQDEIVIVSKGDKDFPGLLESEIQNAQTQIGLIQADMVIVQKRIDNWKPGVLRRNEG